MYKSTRIGFSHIGHLFRYALVEHSSTLLTTFGPKVNDMVSLSDNIHVVFNDNNRVSSGYQCIESFQKRFDIMKMQACGRFVKNKDSRRRFFGR